ncbi:hypothetical protein Tco_0413177 [Tanacetum coccineum]
MLRGIDQLIERKEDGEDYKIEKLSRLYIDEIVARHGVPVSIISDLDERFTLRFLANITESLRDAFGYECGSSSLDGWTKSPLLWTEIRECRLIGLELVQETTNKVILIKERLKAARDCQNSYNYLADANLHVHLEEIKEDKTLHFVEEPVEIIDRGVKSLKRSRIPIVKVH